MQGDIRTTARSTLEEIFPNADVAALADVVHPDCFNHDLPPGMPQGLESMKRVMLMLNRAFPSCATTSTRCSLTETQLPFTARCEGAIPASSWACRQRTAL
jgi:SnoaL-like polyketide cyclase